MRIDLAFGRNGLPVELPAGYNWQVLEARSATPLADADAAIAAALDAPIAGPPLAELARNAKTAAISVCDITRPVPYRRMLPPMLARLEANGIARENITFLIATGLHRPATDAEINEILGPEIASTYRVLNHHARELSEHRHLGTTSTGTPVYIDERFMAADLHLTCGLIEPHLMLGFSGGRKLIAPGVAYQDTIKRIHSPVFMRDPLAIEGSVAGNTVHRELMEISRMARHDFMMDVAITRDRRISGVFAGSPEATHAEAVRFVGAAMKHELDEPVDAVITTSAGYPLDLTYYQCIKGVTAAGKIVKPGGKIMLVAECGEGVGSPDFVAMIRKGLTDRQFLDQIEHAPVVPDQWQLEKLALITRFADVVWYVPGVPRDFWPLLWGTVCDTPEAAIAATLEGLKPGARVAVLPEGPYVLADAPQMATA